MTGNAFLTSEIGVKQGMPYVPMVFCGKGIAVHLMDGGLVFKIYKNIRLCH